MNNKVSVIVPLSNNEPESQLAIKSIINQSYKNIEVIICLNGNTKEFNNQIIKKFRKFKNIFFYKLKKKNIVDALNFAVTKSRGSYIARFDTDDLNYKNRIAKQLKFFKKNNIDFLSSDCDVFLNNEYLYSHHTNFSKSYYTNPIIHPTIFVKKEILKKYKYEQIPYAEDYELYLRLYLSGLKFKNLNKKLIIYNLNSKNIKNFKRAFFLFLSTLVISKGFRERLNVNPKFFSKIQFDKKFERSYKFYSKNFILNKSRFLKIFYGIIFLIFGHKFLRKNILNYILFRNKKTNFLKRNKIVEIKKNYLVSFVIPTFNSEKTIYKTLKSIFSQSYNNKEVIVVDNSTNNKTIKIIKKYFPSVKIVKIKKYILPAEARNIGVKYTHRNSKFISFCDSDDILKPNKTLYQIKKMISDNVEISCTNADFYNVEKKKFYKDYFNYPYEQINFKDLCYKNVVITSSVILTKKLFKSVNGFSESKYFYSFEDYFLWLKILNKTKISFFDQSLLTYIDNRQISASSRSKNIINQRLRILFYFIKLLETKSIYYIVLGNFKLAVNWIEKKIFKDEENEYINLL